MDLIAKSLEIVVDIHCAAAVLRGAHVFAPGIMGMQSGAKLNYLYFAYIKFCPLYWFQF